MFPKPTPIYHMTSGKFAIDFSKSRINLQHRSEKTGDRLYQYCVLQHTAAQAQHRCKATTMGYFA